MSPTSTYSGLTTTAGADKGEPDKYYPAGVRSFARPVPNDEVQARALLAALRDRGCRRVQLLEDRDVAGRGLATAVQEAAEGAGLEVVGRDVLRADDDPRGAARDVAERRADCVVWAGSLAPWVPPLLDALHAADPGLELFGGDDLASPALASALAPGTQARMTLTAPPGVLEPGAAVRAFVRRYREAFGTPARTGALYGFEAMRLTLGAIARAGDRGNDRAAVAKALFGPAPGGGPLGAYRIRPTGDTTSTAYSELGVRGGRLVRRGTRDFPG